MKTEPFQVGGRGMPELCFSDNDFDRIPNCRYVAVFNIYLFVCSCLLYFLILRKPFALYGTRTGYSYAYILGLVSFRIYFGTDSSKIILHNSFEICEFQIGLDSVSRL
jgi:hypothetical protein